eukprot:GHVO01031446.1.p1 GENE.GHVO01031446.1~~GHVO01031446.1.p1  ORF type:complete len:123 (+),score=19.56 GHVO01031446.1:654-1022(+)
MEPPAAVPTTPAVSPAVTPAVTTSSPTAREEPDSTLMPQLFTSYKDFEDSFKRWDIGGTGLVDSRNIGDIAQYVELENYDWDDNGLYSMEELKSAFNVPDPDESQDFVPEEDTHPTNARDSR